MAVNIFAIAFAIFVIIFAPFPSMLPVTADNMNYSGPVFGALVVLLLIFWVISGRHKFTGPLKELLEPRRRSSSKVSGVS